MRKVLMEELNSSPIPSNADSPSSGGPAYQQMLAKAKAAKAARKQELGE